MEADKKEEKQIRDHDIEPLKGSGFQEEHKDIKKSDFERNVSDTDPTKNKTEGFDQEKHKADSL